MIGPLDTIVGQPSVASWGSGRLDVFARGIDGLTKHYWYPGGWGPESLGGQITGTPSAVSWGANRIDVFARGHDDGLKHISYNGSSWAAETWTGLPIAGSPVAVS